MFPPHSDAGTVAAVLERVTGHDVHVVDLQQGSWSAFSLLPNGTETLPLLLIVWHKESPVAAGQAYLKANLDRIRRLKMVEQGGRCLLCPSTGPLQLDHIEERSHSRQDTPENTQLLCRMCHAKKTGTLQWKGETA